MTDILRNNWFVVLIAIIIIGFIGYFIYDTNKDNVSAKSSNNEKKIIKLGMAALTALTMAGCSSESEDVKTITVGISPDYAPYESENKKGDIVGFDPDMMKCFEEYLSEEEGVTYKLEMKKMDFDNIITQLQGDQIDVGISGFTYDSKRKVEWSDPYLGSSQVAVVPKDSDIASTSDLEGKSLVAQTGATGETAAKEVKDAKVTGLKNVQDIMNALSANQYDAAIVDLGVAKNYVKSGEFKMLDESLMDELDNIQKEVNVIKKMNTCIKKFLASEDYAKLCKKYGLSPLETK